MQRKTKILFILLTLFSLISLTALTFLNSPEKSFLITKNIFIPILPIFFLLLFLLIFGFFSLVTKNKIQGIIIGVFVVIYFLLRLFNFDSWFFLLLLIILFSIIEFSYTTRL